MLLQNCPICENLNTEALKKGISIVELRPKWKITLNIQNNSCDLHHTISIDAGASFSNKWNLALKIHLYYQQL